jgi:hypothetical protein
MLGWRVTTDIFGPSLGALYLSRALYICHESAHTAIVFIRTLKIAKIVEMKRNSCTRRPFQWSNHPTDLAKRHSCTTKTACPPRIPVFVSNRRGLAGRRAGDSVSVAIRMQPRAPSRVFRNRRNGIADYGVVGACIAPCRRCDRFAASSRRLVYRTSTSRVGDSQRYGSDATNLRRHSCHERDVGSGFGGKLAMVGAMVTIHR